MKTSAPYTGSNGPSVSQTQSLGNISQGAKDAAIRAFKGEAPGRLSLIHI